MLNPFPVFYLAIDESKYRMRYSLSLNTKHLLRCTLEDFFVEMLGLIWDLSMSEWDFSSLRELPEFWSIKMIPSHICLITDSMQIELKCLNRIFTCPEPDQLWMILVPLSQSSENMIREESLTPAGNESMSIEMPRMEWPETHRMF